jgi:hypothetical protein
MADEHDEHTEKVYTFPKELPESVLGDGAKRSRLLVLAKRKFAGKTLDAEQIDFTFFAMSKKCLRSASFEDRMWYCDVEDEIRKMLMGCSVEVEARAKPA